MAQVGARLVPPSSPKGKGDTSVAPTVQTSSLAAGYDFFDAKSFMNDASAWHPSTGMAL